MVDVLAAAWIAMLFGLDLPPFSWSMAVAAGVIVNWLGSGVSLESFKSNKNSASSRGAFCSESDSFDGGVISCRSF